MGRGVSSGGGQSSLGYLFGSGEEAPKPAATAPTEAPKPEVPKKQAESASNGTPQKSAPASSPQNSAPALSPQNSAPASSPVDPDKPAGVPGNNVNNYFRADGQNCGNFLTDRPTTKVHAAPGGGSSLDYLFGGNEK